MCAGPEAGEHLRNRGRFEKRAQREANAERAFDACEQTRAQQGVTAKGEKIVIALNRPPAQHILPDFREEFFCSSALTWYGHGGTGYGLIRICRKRLAVDLSSGSMRKSIDAHDA